MSDLTDLARPEIAALTAYVPATFAAGLTRLNANEAPWQSSHDTCQRPLNHYPPARPAELTEMLAEQYACPADELLVTRGTSEAIDLLIRAFCRPGVDDIVICPPTFGMYQVYADIQAAGVVRVPLAGPALALPVDAIVARWRDTTKLVFVTTPNNPTGHSVDMNDVERLAIALQGKGIVIIDAAYAEFADPQAIMALRCHEHVIVIRTLSKPYGLAGARCGSLIADERVINLVEKVMPPYAVPTPTVETATAAIASEAFSVMPQRIEKLCAERERVATALQDMPAVVRVWPSDANFLLVEFRKPEQIVQVAQRAGFLIRDFSRQPGTENCLRITIGLRADNDALLAAIDRASMP